MSMPEDLGIDLSGARKEFVSLVEKEFGYCRTKVFTLKLLRLAQNETFQRRNY